MSCTPYDYLDHLRKFRRLMRKEEEEILLKFQADKFNEKLPSVSTGVCSRTEHLRRMKEEIDKVRQLVQEWCPEQLRYRVLSNCDRRNRVRARRQFECHLCADTRWIKGMRHDDVWLFKTIKSFQIWSS